MGSRRPCRTSRTCELAVSAASPASSGKTLAYILLSMYRIGKIIKDTAYIPVGERNEVYKGSAKPIVVVLHPTRESANQAVVDFKRYCFNVFLLRTESAIGGDRKKE